jgi:basic amino acid/polyamine antiporter, APA family
LNSAFPQASNTEAREGVLAIPAASESTTAEANSSGERELRRDLRRPHVLAIVVGAIVGTGIYIRPASIAQLLGSPALIIGVWLVGGILTLCGALTYARLAIRVPGTGGEYLFLRMTLGRLPAFLYGWMRLTVGPAVIGGLAVAFTVFLGDIVPFGGPWIHAVLPWGDGHNLVDLGPRQAITVAMILGLAWINTKGVGRAGTFQLVVTICKVVGLLLLLAAIALLSHSPTEQTLLPSANQDPSPLACGGALLAVMATYNGWANAAILGGEVRDAQRTIPWALVTGILIVTALYVTTNEAFLHTLSFHEIATANSTSYPDAPSVASLAVNRSLGVRAATVLPLLFAFSALGTAHCNVLVIPRVFLSMSRDGLLPTYLTRVAPRSGTPNRAIWTVSVIAATFAVVGTYDRLTNMTTFAYLVFFALTTAGFLWSCRETGSNARGKAFWAITIVAMLFLFGTSALIVASIARGSIEVLTATALISSGIPIFVAAEWLRGRRMERLAAR